ncbi:hypothetical protein M2271_007580 [Streptomyces sp. LBL]|nr:hypothetical protein [Streptomyces sp. LBL]
MHALDQIVQFLAAVSRRPLDAAPYRDRRGAVRLVQRVPAWTDLVDLGFTEVRGCAVGSPQVSRRLLIGLDDLALLAPEERRAPCSATGRCSRRPSRAVPRRPRTGRSRCGRTDRGSADAPRSYVPPHGMRW